MSAGQTSSQVLQDFLAVNPMNLSELSSDEFDELYSTPSSSGGAFSDDNNSLGSGSDGIESQNFLMSSQSSNSSSTLRLVNPKTLTDSQSQPIMDESVYSMKNEPEEQEVNMKEIQQPSSSSSSNALYFDSQLNIESQYFINQQDNNMENFEGKYKFSCNVKVVEPNQQFSQEKAMLFCLPSSNINIQFNCDFDMIKKSSKHALQLNCFLLFKNNRKVVKPCEKHQSEMLNKIAASDVKEFKKMNHALHCTALSRKHTPVYTTTNDGNPYLTIPLGKPTLGMQSVCKLFSFECMNSCHVIAQNKSRGMMVVFELLEGSEVVGRSLFNVKVCACPSRDFQFDEKKSTVGTLETCEENNSTIKKIVNSKSDNHNTSGKKRDHHQPNVKTEENDSQEGVIKKKPRMEASSSKTNDKYTNDCIENLSNLVLGESSSQEHNKRLRVEELSCKAEAILKMTGSSIPLLNYLAYRLKNEIESVHDVINRSHRVLKLKDNKPKTDDDSGTDQTLEEN